MPLNNQLVTMSEKQPWKLFALQGLNFQFLELNFQFLEGTFKMSEPCATSSIHALSVSGADNPSSRYHPLRFCLSAIPTCRYLRLLDIAFHALHNPRYQKSRRGQRRGAVHYRREVLRLFV